MKFIADSALAQEILRELEEEKHDKENFVSGALVDYPEGGEKTED